MSEAEDPIRRDTARTVSIDDVRELMGASTPHFALQIRNRIARLIAGLAEDDPARRLGEREIARLTELGYSGDTRSYQDSLAPLASVGGTRGISDEDATEHSASPHPTAEQLDDAFPGTAGA